MRKYRGKSSKTPCKKCINYNGDSIFCASSKTRHMFNFFGISLIPCLDFNKKSTVKEDLKNGRKKTEIEKIRDAMNFYGYQVTNHFIKRLIERELKPSKAAEIIQMAPTHGKVIHKFNYDGEIAKAYKCFGMTIIRSIDNGTLITIYQDYQK